MQGNWGSLLGSLDSTLVQHQCVQLGIWDNKERELYLHLHYTDQECFPYHDCMLFSSMLRYLLLLELMVFKEIKESREIGGSREIRESVGIVELRKSLEMKSHL